MCGIVGICSRERFLGHEVGFIKKANDIAAYRGPDDQGYLFSDYKSDRAFHSKEINKSIFEKCRDFNVAFAHKRLSIIDISESGHQPMSNKDGKVWIVYNGEIFNYLELKNQLRQAGHEFKTDSDTEVILHSYEEWGHGCVSHFNGMWSFAILDLSKKKLFCSRDRYGIKPFHYYFDKDKFIFASEIKQILECKEVKRCADNISVYDFLSFGSLDHSERTFYEGVYNLLPGNNLMINLGDYSIKTFKYYNPEINIDHSITDQFAEDRFRELLTDSIRLRLRSDVPVGSCLSGGLDSSSIVCIVNRLLKSHCNNEFQVTLSSHFDEKEANEKKYMEEVTLHLDVKSFFTFPKAEDLIGDIESLVWHQEEPFGSTSIYAQWSVFKLAKEQRIKVMLDGQGADEQLAGYVGYYPIYFNELKRKGNIARYMKEMFLYRYRHGKFFDKLKGLGGKSYPSMDLLNDDILKYSEQSCHLKNISQNYYGETEELNNILYDHTMRSNLQQLLHYEDRNSMAFSVEGRVPFLDYRLVEFVFSLPSHFKIRNGYTKNVLRRSMEAILPKKIQYRVSKLGFATPEKKWQVHFLKPLIEDTLASDELKHYLLIDQATQWWKIYQQDADMVSFIPWRWASLYLWLKCFDVTA